MLTHARSRRGLAIAEAVCALLLIGAVMTLIGQVVVQVGRTGREADRRQFARQMAHAALERARLLPWQRLLDLQQQQQQPPRSPRSPAAVQLPPGWEVRLQAEPQDDVLKITAEVRWQDDAGVPLSLQLRAWRHRPVVGEARQ